MEHEPIWGVTRCFQGMHSTSHLRSSFLTSMNSRMGSTQTAKGA